MDFKPLFDQLDRLNKNLETWIGLVATLNQTPAAAPAAAVETPAAPAAAETETEGKGRGRPRKRYFYNSAKQWVQENTSSPGAEWVEVTKTKFEEIRDKIARGELKPAGTEAPAETAPAASDDPFADDEPTATTKALTLDDVRAAAFKVRDKFGMDEARTLIGKYAAKLDQVKPEDFAKLIADCDAKIGASDL